MADEEIDTLKAECELWKNRFAELAKQFNAVLQKGIGERESWAAIMRLFADERAVMLIELREARETKEAALKALEIAKVDIISAANIIEQASRDFTAATEQCVSLRKRITELEAI